MGTALRRKAQSTADTEELGGSSPLTSYQTKKDGEKKKIAKVGCGGIRRTCGETQSDFRDYEYVLKEMGLERGKFK